MTERPGEVGRIRRGPRQAAPPRNASLGARDVAPDRIVLEQPARTVICAAASDRGRLSLADRAVLAAARSLARSDGAVLLAACVPLGSVLADDHGVAGADRVVVFSHPGFADHAPALRARALASLLGSTHAAHVVMADEGESGETGRRLAAAMGDHAATGVVGHDGDRLVCLQDGGRSEGLREVPRVVLVDPLRFAAPPVGPAREGRIIDAPGFDSPEPPARLEQLPLDPASVPLGEAILIMAAGHGVSDWDAFRAVANGLGAAVGGSRVVCDAGLLPRERQVGVSGTIVRPRCYIAVGISGASQHLQGIADAQRVVAINTDPRAEMMKRADLAVVGDARPILNALARLVGPPA